jgi:hypothetical protein
LPGAPAARAWRRYTPDRHRRSPANHRASALAQCPRHRLRAQGSRPGPVSAGNRLSSRQTRRPAFEATGAVARSCCERRYTQIGLLPYFSSAIAVSDKSPRRLFICSGVGSTREWHSVGVLWHGHLPSPPLARVGPPCRSSFGRPDRSWGRSSPGNLGTGPGSTLSRFRSEFSVQGWLPLAWAPGQATDRQENNVRGSGSSDAWNKFRRND